LLELELFHQLLDAEALLLQPMLLLSQRRAHCTPCYSQQRQRQRQRTVVGVARLLVEFCLHRVDGRLLIVTKKIR
jgi:hypothetical protein